jgi:poly-gamma-glutamate capsule biosynthesis protein CapA/YwtB (metallophosphatase superfamily)
LKLFLCGDVMTGRGIDQVLRHPSDPVLHEGYAASALGYVRLAEECNGPIPRAADPAYIWGDALAELERTAPAARIVNLETAVTASDDWLPKGINYRMHPANVACLAAARIDCCALANNHVLDWGRAGLLETLATLNGAQLKTAGAGANRSSAETPAALQLNGAGRLLVFSFGMESGGIPPDWAAGADAPGVDFLPDLSSASLARIGERVRSAAAPGDLVLASIHWGGNWDYEVTDAERRFAHALIDRAGVHLIHGHSSHHPKAIEVHRGKLILYGCGDFINDYEGIRGHEAFRGDLGLMYFPDLEAGSGRLLRLELVPMRRLRFRVTRAGEADTCWLCDTLDRESRRFGVRTGMRADGRIELQ